LENPYKDVIAMPDRRWKDVKVEKVEHEPGLADVVPHLLIRLYGHMFL